MGGGDSSGSGLIIIKLGGDNFFGWSRIIKMVYGVKLKFRFIDGISAENLSDL